MATATFFNPSQNSLHPCSPFAVPSRGEHMTMFKSLRHKLSQKKKTSSAQMTMERDAPQQIFNSASTQPVATSSNSNPFKSADEDAPPAYSPAPNAAPMVSQSIAGPSSTTAATDGADDPYTFLSSFDTIFLIDDSGSMAGARWRETADALQTITPICTAHDADGIDIYFLNHRDSSYCHNVTSSATVREIFQTVRPGGGTPTGQRINQILKPYIRRYEENPENTKPINLICITDGVPSDDVEMPLIQAAKKLDKLEAPAWQVGVQFFQVGHDEYATEHLKQLDDELEEIAGCELRDMVDTVPFSGDHGAQLTGDGVLKVVLGAVLRRLDRKSSKDIHR